MLRDRKIHWHEQLIIALIDFSSKKGMQGVRRKAEARSL